MPQKLQYRSASVSSVGPPWWRQRWGALTIGAIALALLIFTFAGKSWPNALYVLLTDGALLVLWLVSATGYGATTMVLLRAPGPGENPGAKAPSVTKPGALTPGSSGPLCAVTAIAIGLGLMSLLQVLLGLAGLLQTPVAYVIIVIGVALVAVRFRHLSGQSVSSWLTASVDWEYVWLLATPLLATAIVAALVPPGVLWGDEPHGYDVLEYHLQLPREWYELERITPLQHNVFSYFPLNVEMHFLLAMQLKGGPWRGMYLAQLMHVAMIAVTVFAIYATARLFATKSAAIVAALAAGATPWMLLLAPVAYNEGGLLLFGTLAIGWLLRAVSDGRGAGSFIIAGLFVGFACGVKLTAIPVLLIIAPIVALAVVCGRKTAAIRLAVYILAATVAFSPWLVKNAVWARNPVFPEGQSIFGGAHFTPVQSERWKRAHSATEEQKTFTARLVALKQQVVVDQRYGYTLIPAGLIAALITIRRRESQLLFALLVAYAILWVGFTHLQGRFFVLAIPMAAIALAMWRPVMGVVPLVVGFYFSFAVFFTQVWQYAEMQVLGAEDFSALIPTDVQLILNVDKNDPHFALAGDAKAFLYQIPMKRLRYRTVFDVQNKTGDDIVQAWLGQQEGAPYIVIDPLELQRFTRTYYGLPRFGPGIDVPRDRVTVLKPQSH